MQHNTYADQHSESHTGSSATTIPQSRWGQSRAIRISLSGLLGVYIAFSTWLSYHSLDKRVRALFGPGQGQWLLVGSLVAVYSLSTLVTVWFVRLLYRVTYKLAAGPDTQITLTNLRALGALVVAFLCNGGAIWIKQATSSSLGVLLLVVPLGVISWLGWVDEALNGIRKAWAGTPLYLFVILSAWYIIWAGFRP